MKKVAQLLILLVLVILILPFFLPKKMDLLLEREFNANAGVLFENFNNLNEFSKWEPWSAEFPEAIKEFSAPYRGKNAGYKWTFLSKHNQTIISESNPFKNIQYLVEGYGFGGGKSIMTVDFMSENEEKTKVKWRVISDDMNYFSRYYIYFSKEKLLQKLNLGFDRLETLLASDIITPKQSQSLSPGIIKKEAFEGLKLVAVLNSTSLEKEEIETATEESFGMIYSYLVDYLKFPPTSIAHPINYFESINIARKTAKFYSGFPLNESIKLDESMQLISIPAVEALVCIHKGSQKDIEQTLMKMKNYATENNLKIKNTYWEEYMGYTGEKSNNFIKLYIPIQ